MCFRYLKNWMIIDCSWQIFYRPGCGWCDSKIQMKFNSHDIPPESLTHVRKLIDVLLTYWVELTTLFYFSVFWCCFFVFECLNDTQVTQFTLGHFDEEHAIYTILPKNILGRSVLLCRKNINSLTYIKLKKNIWKTEGDNI